MIPVPRVIAECRNLVDARTNPLRSAAGVTVVLKMHGEDDHGRNTHLCQTEYSLLITDPQTRSAVTHSLFSVDDAWGRRIEFSVQGYTGDGSGVVALISDGPPFSLNIIEFDLRTNAVRSSPLLPEFLRELGDNCASTLHVVGTSTAGAVVLTTEATGKCTRPQFWLVTPGELINGIEHQSRPAPLKAGARIIALDPGTAPNSAASAP